MNIFVVNPDPVRAARQLCDQHVIKMTLESAQMLCTAANLLGSDPAPYKSAYVNHPCSVWVRESLDNYRWLCRHGLALAQEYTRRYGKRHRSEDVIRWCQDRAALLDLPATGLTEHPRAMPDRYKTDCVIHSYRLYYRGDKARFATWNKSRPAPHWWSITGGE